MHSHKTNYVSVQNILLQSPIKYETEFSKKKKQKILKPNTMGHIQALVTQQRKQIEEAIEEAQNKQLEKQAEEQNISLKEFDGILQPIIDACTKDSISQGKYNKVNLKS